MELTGKIISVLEPRSGKSQASGKDWMTQEYVIETHDQYPKKMVFNIFGEDKIKQAAINPGDEVTVSFDVNAREYNGRWYNDIRAWKVDHVAAPAAEQAPQTAFEQAPQDAPFTQPSQKDDLPF
ncbi:MAG: DUF3127 domain-containing protein [Bacteroidaceae bacterium]|nr:DUF3127 domain-containing protein [Bacteroidaceae bacterium]